MFRSVALYFGLLFLACVPMHNAMAYTPPSYPPNSPTCTAATSSQLVACVTAMAGYNGTSDLTTAIMITAPIICTGANACHISVQNLGTVSVPIQIYGDSNVSNAGFNRTDTYDYSIIDIDNSSYVTISNLIFNETQANVAATGQPNGLCTGSDYPSQHCNPPISIGSYGDSVIGTSNISLAGITVNNSKDSGIIVSHVRNLSITNSTIENSYYFGIQFDPALPSVNTDVSIQGNVFYANRSNAIIYTGTASSPALPSTISGNTFNHNHHNAAYATCGGPCGGGQLALQNGLAHLVVANNTFSNGYMDTDPSIDGYQHQNPADVNGIELVTGVSDLTILRNTLDRNSSMGIVTDPPASGPTSAAGVFAYQNEIWGNQADTGAPVSGTAQIRVPGAELFENCYSSSCLGSVVNNTPEIADKGLSCTYNQCMWIYATDAGANCSVGIYAPDWSSQLATITSPAANCSSQGVSYTIPGSIISQYSSVNVNYQNTSAGTLSAPVLISLAAAQPQITGAGLGCNANQCMWITVKQPGASKCAVNIYAPDWSALLATVSGTNINCFSTEATFYIPPNILANYNSVNVNYQNQEDQTWSAPVLVKIH